MYNVQYDEIMSAIKYAAKHGTITDVEAIIRAYQAQRAATHRLWKLVEATQHDVLCDVEEVE